MLKIWNWGQSVDNAVNPEQFQLTKYYISTFFFKNSRENELEMFYIQPHLPQSKLCQWKINRIQNMHSKHLNAYIYVCVLWLVKDFASKYVNIVEHNVLL